MSSAPPSTSPQSVSAARQATTVPPPWNTWSAPMASSPSSRSTLVCSLSTQSLKKPPAWTWCASTSASLKAKSCASRKTLPHVATLSSSASTVKTQPQASCQHQVLSPATKNQLVLASASTPVCAWARSSAVSSTPCWAS